MNDNEKRMFEKGANAARCPLTGHWSPDALMQGWGDLSQWTEEEKQAYREGYRSVRHTNAIQERWQDARQDFLIADFELWESQQKDKPE